ncbi:hypothetical protein BKA70DRAFT_1404335 [Coprinopsis sp. MPI-PUGE-AT-0042]|nr:hypothetical protein BKA70DRAFT_1404335 [Coprinopsis sp. MPI-PUGE-AT-0042]
MAIPWLYSSNYAVGGPTAHAFLATLVLPPPKDDTHTREFRLFPPSPQNCDTIPKHLHCLRLAWDEAALPLFAFAFVQSGLVRIDVSDMVHPDIPWTARDSSNSPNASLRAKDGQYTNGQEDFGQVKLASHHTKSFQQGGTSTLPPPTSLHPAPRTNLIPTRGIHNGVEQRGRVFVNVDGRHGRDEGEGEDKNDVASRETLTLPSNHHQIERLITSTEIDTVTGARGAVGVLEYKGLWAVFLPALHSTCPRLLVSVDEEREKADGLRVPCLMAVKIHRLFAYRGTSAANKEESLVSPIPTVYLERDQNGQRSWLEGRGRPSSYRAGMFILWRSSLIPTHKAPLGSETRGMVAGQIQIEEWFRSLLGSTRRGRLRKNDMDVNRVFLHLATSELRYCAMKNVQ